MTGEPTPDELRDDLALRLLCAFNGVDPNQAPAGWRVFPNESTRAAWQRVAAVIEQELADFAALKVDIESYVKITSDQADEIERWRSHHRLAPYQEE